MAKIKINDGKYKPSEVTSIRQIMDGAVAACPDQDAYIYRVGNTDELTHVTYRQFYDDCDDLGAFLTDIGMGSAHIACTGENRYEWIVAFLTTLMSAGVYVPIDKELPSADKLHIVDESEASVLFFTHKYEKWVRDNKDQMPGVKYFIGFDLEEDEEDILSYTRCLEKGRQLDKTAYRSLHSDEYEMKELVYTSGTTGIAKGVMLTEHNLCSLIYYGFQVTQLYDRGVSLLPYHHTYEANCDILPSLYYHTTLCINKSMKNLVNDMKLFQPSYIYIVPALAEFLYASITKNIQKQGKEKSFNAAVKLSKAMRKIGIDLRPILFKDILEVFGGRLIKIICGGAAIRPEIGEFFDIIGIYLTGGYGITECTPLVSVNDEHTITYDTVGHRLGCIDWRIDEPNEEGIGEIAIKGDIVMLGYYKNPEETAKVMTEDGWFSTGDYGYITKNDELVITGRKKNVIVLNNGKNVYPEEIEKYIQNIPYVTEVVVRSFVNERGEETSLMAELYLDGEYDERTVLKDISVQLRELPSYKQVTSVKFRTEAFPKTSSNKIKRNA